MIRAFVLAGVLMWCPALVASPSEAPEATSPYFRMHSGDPIRWHPWNDAALSRARAENKPILVSLGYASCHWCLTMNERTFRNPEVAAAVNRAFVPILVDREERPDLDAWFMRVKLAMDGQGGWPLTLFLTPDLVPLFAANYLSPQPEHGQPGFLDVAEGLAAAWSKGDTGMMSKIEEIRGQMQALAAPGREPGAGGNDDPRTLSAQAWLRRLDPVHGGFGGGAKFPRPEVLTLLLDEGIRQGDDTVIAKVAGTLDAMAAGAIRDQLGGLFHRYTADRFWREPHYEVTLADNAQLALVYLRAFQITKDRNHLDIARSILHGMKARLGLAGGGFASALSADNADGEGRLYTWTRAEIRAHLAAEADSFIAAYMGPGNETARVPLRLADPKAATAQAPARLRLSRERASRPPVPRDDKLVAPWNAMAASAFALAARLLDDDDSLAVARSTIAAILPDGKVAGHSSLDGRWSGTVILDDYAFAILALIDLYETGFDTADLAQASRLAHEMLALFQQSPGQPLQLTPLADKGDIPSLTILDEDGAPSGMAAALAGLRRLASYGASETIQREAGAIAERLRASHRVLPAGLAAAWSYGGRDGVHVAISGRRDDPATKALLAAYRPPGATLALIDPDLPPPLDWFGLAPRPLVDGKPAAYVCSGGICQLPITDPQALAAHLAPSP